MDNVKPTVFIKTSYPRVDFLMALIYMIFVVGVSLSRTLATQEFIFQRIGARDVFTLLVGVCMTAGMLIAMVLTSMLGIHSPYMNLLVFIGTTMAVAALMLYLNIEYYTKSKPPPESMKGRKQVVSMKM